MAIKQPEAMRAVEWLRSVGIDCDRVRSIELRMAFDEPTTITITRLAKPEQVDILLGELSESKERWVLQSDPCQPE